MRERLARRLAAAGPVGTLLAFVFWALLLLGVSRWGLVLWQWPRLEGVEAPWKIFTLGLRMDLVVAGYLIAVLLPVLLLPSASPTRLRLAAAVLTALGTLLLFIELATPGFMTEFDHRPDRLFFEYLENPREVFGMLWREHRTIIVGVPLLAAALAWAQWRGWLAVLRIERAASWRERAIAAPLLLVAGFIAVRGLDHRPINLSDAAFSSNRLANELVANSTYTLGYAAYSVRQETGATRAYGKMPWPEVLARVRKYLPRADADFISQQIPTLRRTGAAPRLGPPTNLVILVEESLGAAYVGSLGGLKLTPNLDRLAARGWFFEHMYATGTRTARGLEAIAAGFPPTPAPPVLKLERAKEKFFTLGALLKQKGYATEFIYGGVANFDNMRAFFLANGFDRVIEEQDFESPVFQGSWGVSDEDWVAKAHETFVAHGEQPFFALMLSTSNHDPFEFPEGRIEPYEQPLFTRHNAMKYADYAIGKFFELAQAAPYYRNTIFVVVADHDARVYGSDFVPVEHFRVPALILGPGVPVLRDARLASQIDLGPTLLHLLGVNVAHPMIGRDLLRLPPGDPGRAIMQYANQHGFRVGNRLVVHQPDKQPLSFQVNPDDSLVPAPSDPELVRDALAHALWPAKTYDRRLYRPD